MRRQQALWGALLVCALTSIGCPPRERGSGSEREAAEPGCSKAYSQCKLPQGNLGVCNPRECGAGEHAPCFSCLSQH